MTTPENYACSPADLVPDLTDTRSIPPFIGQGVRVLTFPVAADPLKLLGLCNRYLNDPAPGHAAWVPMAPMIYIQILQYDRLFSEPYADLGFIRQNELAIQIPIMSPLKEDGPRAGFFAPFLVVDNPVSLTVGREVFGYPKTYGSFQIDDSSFSVSNWLTPTQGPDVPLEEHPLIEQTTFSLGAAVDTPEEFYPFGPSASLFRSTERSYASEDDMPPFALEAPAEPLMFVPRTRGILPPAVAVEALKQIDSTTLLTPGPQKAAYQARISAQTSATQITGAGPIAALGLTVHRYDPLDLVDIFGLQQIFGRVPTFFPFWMDLDFRLDQTDVLTCHC